MRLDDIPYLSPITPFLKRPISRGVNGYFCGESVVALGSTSTFSSGDNTTSFTYDSNGNRATLLDPNGGRITYGYDGNEQVTSLQDNVSGRATMIYDAAGRRTLRVLADGTSPL